MKQNSRQELTLFRNVNGCKKICSVKDGRVSYMNSSEELHLRNNQGTAKAKFIKFIVDSGKDKESWLKGEI